MKSNTIAQLGSILLLCGTPLVFCTALADALTPPKLLFFFCGAYLIIGNWLLNLAFPRSQLFSNLTKHPELLLAVSLYGWLALRGIAADNWNISRHTMTYLTLGLLFPAWSFTTTQRQQIKGFYQLTLTALLMSLYSILQRFQLDPIGWVPPDDYPTMIIERTISTMGNPNYLGAFLAAIWPLSLACLLHQLSRQKKLPLAATILLAAIPAFILATATLTQNRSTWLALLSCPVTMGVIHYKNHRKHLLVPNLPRSTQILTTTGVISILIIAFLACNTPLRRSYRWKTSLTTRMYLWKSACFIGFNHPLTGVGTDRYRFAALQYRKLDSPDARAGLRIPDNPHNEFLKFLAEGGFPAFLSSLTLFYLIGVKLSRYQPTDLTSYLLQLGSVGALGSLAISYQFNCSTIPSSVLLPFILSNLYPTPTKQTSCSNHTSRPSAYTENAPATRPSLTNKLTAITLWALFTSYGFSLNICQRLIWLGDDFRLQGHAAAAHNRSGALTLYHKALTYYLKAQNWSWSDHDYTPTILSSIGKTLVGIYQDVGIIPGIADKALQAFQEASRYEPDNPYPWADRAYLFTLMSQSNPSFQNRAIQAWKEAIRRDPWNPIFSASLAQLLSKCGRLDEAGYYYLRSLQSDPRQGDVALAYARLLHRLHRLPQALHWLDVALRLKPEAESEIKTIRKQWISEPNTTTPP